MLSKEGFKMSIKFINTMLIPLLTLLFGVMVIFISLVQFERVNQKWAVNSAATIDQFTQEILKNQSETLKLSTDYILANQELIDAFKERDRERLISLITPIYNYFLQNYGITLIHFHELGPVSFLRSNLIDKYGDSLDFRKDVVKVQKTKTPLLTYSPGKSGVGIRYIVPIILMVNLLDQ